MTTEIIPNDAYEKIVKLNRLSFVTEADYLTSDFDAGIIEIKFEENKFNFLEVFIYSNFDHISLDSPNGNMTWLWLNM